MQMLPTGQSLYALVDAAQVERFTVATRGLRGVLAQASVYAAPLSPDRFDATPHLLELQSVDSCGDLLQSGLGRAVAFPGAVSLLVSPLTIAELATRLRTRLDTRLPDRLDCINRYFDGRITPHLFAVLTTNQRAAFFGVASQWWVVSHHHVWQSLECRYSVTETFIAPLELDDQQQATMIDACYPYTVIEHFLQTDEELLETVSPSERYAFFQRALATAALFGIDGGASAMLFCALCLTRGADFYKLEDWPQWLERVQRGELTLQQAVKAHHD